MVELKTLKDIITFGVDFSVESVGKSLSLVSNRDLKKEAIKWIKNEESQTTDSIDAWIKHFFNISEEDLE